jgi:hypothetical protein
LQPTVSFRGAQQAAQVHSKLLRLMVGRGCCGVISFELRARCRSGQFRVRPHEALSSALTVCYPPGLERSGVEPAREP